MRNRLKLFEQFNEDEDCWWEKESIFDEPKPLESGDIIVRTWPSGNITLGVVTNDFMFKSLENYPYEGGVTKGHTYEHVVDYNGKTTSYSGKLYRLATEKEKEKLKNAH